MKAGWAAWLVLSLAPPAQDDKVKVEFEDIELEALAEQVQRVTKKSFLYQEALLKGRKVTLRSEKPITPDEFYRVFQSVALLHGFALVPAPEENINLVKIVPAPQAAKEPGAQPVLGRGEKLPAGEGVIFYVLTPKYVSGQRAAAVVQPALSPSGQMVPVPNSDLLLIIDAAAAVRRAEKLLGLIDVVGEPIVVASVILKSLQASSAKTRVAEFVQAIEKVQTGEVGRARIEILADERLNQLTFVGREVEVKSAQDFLAQIDIQLPSVLRTIGYYRLKNVPVAELVDTVRQFLGLSPLGLTGSRGGGTPERRSSGLPGAPRRDLAGAPVMPPGVTPPPVAGRPLVEPPQEGQPPLVGEPKTSPAASGDVEVLALEGQNTLVVIANAAVHEEVKKILENLDKRKGQVLIEVAILQVTGDDSLETGVEVLFQDTRGNGAKVAGGLGSGTATQTDPGGTGFPTTHTLSSFQGGAFRYVKPDDISALIKLVSTKAGVNILSQPLLLVNDNEPATFSTKVSEPTIAVSQGTVGNVTSFAGFAEAVTELSITPTLSPDGYLNLRITQSFEEFTGEASAAGVPPTKVSNNVQTLITVPDRHTAILGGFTRDSMTDTRTGIPVLMDIPLIGWLAGSTSTRRTKSRLYLFVRPRILSAEGFDDLKSVSREKAGGANQLIRDPSLRLDVDSGRPKDPSVREAPLPK